MHTVRHCRFQFYNSNFLLKNTTFVITCPIQGYFLSSVKILTMSDNESMSDTACLKCHEVTIDAAGHIKRISSLHVYHVTDRSIRNE